MASVLTSDELSNPTDGFFGVTGAAGQAASVQATPDAVGTEPVRVRFSTDEKIILLKKVIASGPHVAGYGKKEKKFEKAGKKINANPHLCVTVKTRAVQMKFNNMLEEFRRRDSKDRKKSGAAEDMCEEDMLLSSIVDAVDDMNEAEDIEKGETAEAKSRKSAASDRALAMANGEISAGDADGRNSAEDGKRSEDQDADTPRRKRRRKTPIVAQMNDGLARFEESMRDIEIAKVDLQAKRLASEESCREDLMCQRAERRLQNAEEHKKREAADMNRLQAMLLFAVKSINTAKKQ